MAQKFRRPNTFMTLGFILFGLAMFLLPFGSAIPLIISMGIIGGIPAGSIMAMPASVLRPESRAVGMGLFWTIYYGVYASLPPLAGLALDFAKSTASPLFFGAGLLFVSISLLAWFRLIKNRLAVQPKKEHTFSARFGRAAEGEWNPLFAYPGKREPYIYLFLVLNNNSRSAYKSAVNIGGGNGGRQNKNIG